jgi:hypothetical protein
MTALYIFGNRVWYQKILTFHGITPLPFPFVDTEAVLSAWECTRLGFDVFVYNPCDVLWVAHSYSPLWLVAASVRLTPDDAGSVGWIIDLAFLLSFFFLPPGRRLRDAAIVGSAAISTMVVFAVERANVDVIFFLLAVLAGFLALCRGPVRVISYGIGLFAGLLKYYPLSLLILSFRERIWTFVVVNVGAAAVITIFLVRYFADVRRSLSMLPIESYFTVSFASENLPFGLVATVQQLSLGSLPSPLSGYISYGLYAVLLLGCIAISRSVLQRTTLGSTLPLLSGPEEIFLVIGAVLITGCFFTGQNIGYRGVFLLLTLPGLLAVSRFAGDRRTSRLALSTTLLIILIMWGEFFRTNLVRGLLALDTSGQWTLFTVRGFWLARELAWWWTVSVFVSVLIHFAAESEVGRTALRRVRSFAAGS